MPKAVLVTPRSFSHCREDVYPLFEKAGYRVIENTTGRVLTEDEMVSLCRDVEGVVVGLDPLTSRVLESARNLRAISRYGTGMDNIDLKKAKELKIKVMDAGGANSTSVAELAIGFLFCLSRHVFRCLSDVKKGQWTRVLGTELAGRTLGVVGCGRIGREVVKRAVGLGMTVLVHDDWFTDEAFLKAYSARKVDLATLLKESDFVSLHCPLTPQTRHLINAETIRYMKSSACLINTARGELVDEDALYEALYHHRLAGAAQDVFSTEPPKPGSKILELDNFLLTPHIGGYTEEAVKAMAIVSAKNLLQMLGINSGV